MYAEIIVDIASTEVDRLFTYRVPEGMALSSGQRVSVPFGPGKKEGYVVALKADTDYDKRKIKDVLAPLEDYPALLPPLMALAGEIRDKTHCPLCEALRLMLPAQMRGGRVKVKTEQVARLLLSGEKLRAFTDKLPRNGFKKRTLLTLLSDGEVHPVEELKTLVSNPREALNQLKDAGVIELSEREKLRAPLGGAFSKAADPPLMPRQEEALLELLSALRTVRDTTEAQRRESRAAARKFAFLLFGVTGSGKTEVYIRLVRECLKMGRGAIVLVPEIVLTPQMTDWFRARFGASSAVLHSRLTPGERFDEWRRIRRGEARVVIGARSAVFAPIENLGAIIVDEEHEQSYLSESFPQYDAREIASMRAMREGALVLLASATPSITSFAMARRGDYTLLEMPERVMNRPLPEITVVDMREELRRNNRSIFSALLQSKLRACIASGQQAMLFLNRRGFAPYVSCRMCGTVLKCAQCDVSMTYHSADNRLHCHYCGATAPLPEHCPSCGSTGIRTAGVGTQRVEEELHKLFPEVTTIRMDLDTTGGKNALYELLNAFRAREAQVLIGTQMIAKGLDFPNVTLVGAVLADMTLNLPDYRAPERTFQLLVQVAGRAGRAEHKGDMIIQTYKPEHYAIAAAQKQDYRAFFEEEFSYRRARLYPPFTLIARFLCEADGEQAALEAAVLMRDKVRAYLEAHTALKKRLFFIRADKAPIAFIQGRHRAHTLMKLLNHPDSEEMLAEFTAFTEGPFGEGVRVCLEINPATLA